MFRPSLKDDKKCSDDKTAIQECNNGQWETTKCLNQKCDPENFQCVDCLKDDTKCSDDKKSILKCNNGQWETTTCPDNQICDSTTYQCAEENTSNCTNGEKKCSDDKKSILECINGQWTTTTCLNQICDPEKFECVACLNDDKKCSNDKKSIQKCINGQWETTKCPNNQICNSTTYQCVDNYSLCTDGDIQCKSTGEDTSQNSYYKCTNGFWMDFKCPAAIPFCITKDGNASCVQCANRTNNESENSNDISQRCNGKYILSCHNNEWVQGTDCGSSTCQDSKSIINNENGELIEFWTAKCQ